MGTKGHGLRLLHIRGQIGFDQAAEPDALIAHITDCLERASAKNIRFANSTVEFTGGARRWVTTANALVNFDRGSVTVDRANRIVTYRIRFYETFAISFAFGLVFAVFLGWNTEEWIYALVGGTPGLLMFAGNVVTGSMKFRQFLISALGSAPRTAR